MEYKAEIDGLRAIAVVSVIIYHLNGNLLPGGYLGVDIFFVISGYLITSLISSEILAGKFSLNHFWMRRIRRLLPALLAVLIFTSFSGLYLLTQPIRGEFNQQVATAIISLSNYYYYFNSHDYWGIASESLPLLHTWSLAVEEQFYLIYPLVLLVIWNRFHGYVISILFFLCLAGFAIYVYSVFHDSVGSFYLLKNRFWQLMSGGVIAVFCLDNRSTHSVTSKIFLYIGLLFLSISLFNLKLFIGIPYRLLATVGTLLIILSIVFKDNVITILGNKFIVFVGLISYSLYLWHWPIIVYIKGFTEDYDIFSTVMFIFAVSTASYYFIEKPIRYKTGNSFIISSSLLIIFIISIVAYEFTPISPLLKDFGNIETEESLEKGQTYEATTEIVEGSPGKIYKQLGASNKKGMVVLGSSHARMLSNSLNEIADELGLPFISMSTSGVGITTDNIHNRPLAQLINENRLKSIKALKPYICIVAGMWSSESKDQLFVNKLKLRLLSISNHSQIVIVLGQIPLPLLPEAYSNSLRKYILAQKLSSGTVEIQADQYVKSSNMIVQKIVDDLNQSNIYYLNPYDQFIRSENVIRLIEGGKFLFADKNHLNTQGAKIVAQFLRVNSRISFLM